MEINQDYMHFKRWYKDTESAIHCGQWDDEQIAYAAYCEGMKRVKTCNKPAVVNNEALASSGGVAVGCDTCYWITKPETINPCYVCNDSNKWKAAD